MIFVSGFDGMVSICMPVVFSKAIHTICDTSLINFHFMILRCLLVFGPLTVVSVACAGMLVDPVPMGGDNFFHRRSISVGSPELKSLPSEVGIPL